MNGVIRRYLTDKRFGFILPEDGSGTEVFFHLSMFDAGEDGPPPIMGERVEYTLGDTSRASAVTRLVSPLHRFGSVKSYDPVKGYGFLQTSDGQCYLHKSEVLGGLIPSVGSRVNFYTTDNPAPNQSPRACYIAVLT